MKTVTHKGYQASVEFEDGTLFIKILHISDLVIGECDSAAAVQATAEALIEEYIETCKELGREPQVPFKGSFNVRMTPEVHRRVAMAAAGDGMTLNAYVNAAVVEKMECSRIEERLERTISKRYVAELAPEMAARARQLNTRWQEPPVETRSKPAVSHADFSIKSRSVYARRKLHA